jgi:hypothetical protein
MTTRGAGSSSGLAWTPRKEFASNGEQFDDRPTYVVKLP